MASSETRWCVQVVFVCSRRSCIRHTVILFRSPESSGKPDEETEATVDPETRRVEQSAPKPKGLEEEVCGVAAPLRRAYQGAQLLQMPS